MPDHDVLLAGFPCQPFSIAGVSKKNALGRPHGFECTTQGTLFFDVARIIATKQPRRFCWKMLRTCCHTIHRLTPREYARLMDFPDSFKIRVGDKHAYQKFEQAAVVPMIKEVSRIMCPHITALVSNNQRGEKAHAR